MVDALQPFRDAAAGLPAGMSDAMPVARICADGRHPGSVTTITAGDLRAFVTAHPDSATPSGDGGEAAISDIIRSHVFCDLSSPDSISAGIEAAAAAILSRIVSTPTGVTADEPPRDAARALKEALFACLHEGCADRQYGGVLTEGGKYAWVRFTREFPADAAQPTNGPKIGAKHLYRAIDAFLAHDPAALKAADANPQE